MTPPTITTDRLILTALDRRYFEDHCATMADPRVTAMIGSGQPQSRIETWRRFCQFAGLWPLLGFGYWAMLERASGRMIGAGGLALFERGIEALEGVPELGYALNAERWGRGLVSEAVAAILRWSDDELAAPEVRAVVAADNPTSIAVLRKAGFTHCDQVEDTDALIYCRRRA